MAASRELIKAEYQGIEISFSEKGWFNATIVAANFGKLPHEWLRLPETEKYIEALCEVLNTGKSLIIKTQRGKSGGTWFHPKLAIPFARWMEPRFAVWCDLQIDSILRGTHTHFDWKKIRHQATSSFKVMNEALRLVREEQGKVSASHHFSNESRLINWVLCGEFKGVDRNSLSTEDLDMLSKLEVKNAILIARNLPYQDRKKMLEQYAIDLRSTGALLLTSIDPTYPTITQPNQSQAN